MDTSTSHNTSTDSETTEYISALTSTINDTELSLTGHDRQLFIQQVSKMYNLCCDLYGVDTARRKTKQFAADFIHVCSIGAKFGQQSQQYIQESHRMHQRVLQNDTVHENNTNSSTQSLNPLQQLYHHVVQLRTSILSAIPASSEKEVKLKSELEQKLNAQLKHLNDASNKFASSDADSIVYKQAIAQLGWSTDSPNNPLIQLSAALSDTGSNALTVTDKLQRVSQQLQALSKAVTEQQKQLNGKSPSVSVTQSTGKHTSSSDSILSATVNGQSYTYTIHSSAAALPDNETVMLETNDQQLIKVSKKVAARCGAVKTKLDKHSHSYARISTDTQPAITLLQQPNNKNQSTVDLSNTIPTLKFPDVTMTALKRVINYCATAFPTDSQRFLTELRSTPISSVPKSVDDSNNAVLCELASASFYLDCKELVEMSCRAIAESIRGKSPQAIREAFNIQNDFTASEERAMKKEMVAQAMFAPTMDDYISPAQIAQTVINDNKHNTDNNTEAQKKFANQLSQQINQLTNNKTSELKPIDIPHTHTHPHSTTLRDHAQSLLSSTLPLDKLPTHLPGTTTYVSSTITTSMPMSTMDCGCEGCHSMSSRNGRRNVLNVNIPGSLPLPPLPHNTHSHYHHNNALIARNKLRNKLQSSRNAANQQNGKSTVSNDISPTHDNNLSVDELLDFINQSDEKTGKSKSKSKGNRKQNVVSSKALPDISILNAEIEQVLKQGNNMLSTTTSNKPTVDVSSVSTQPHSAATTPSLTQPFCMPTFNEFQLGTKSSATTPSQHNKSHINVIQEHKPADIYNTMSVATSDDLSDTLSLQIEQRLNGLEQWEQAINQIENDVSDINESIDINNDSKSNTDGIEESARLNKIQKYLQQLQLSMPNATNILSLNTQLPILPTQSIAHAQPRITSNHHQYNTRINATIPTVQSLATMSINLPSNVLDTLKTTSDIELPTDTLICHCIQPNIVPLSVSDAIQPTVLVCDKCGLLPTSAVQQDDTDTHINKSKINKSTSKPVKIEHTASTVPAPLTLNTNTSANSMVKSCENCSKLEKQLKSTITTMDDKLSALDKSIQHKLSESEKQFNKKLADEATKRQQLESLSKKIDLVVTEQIHTIDKHRDRIDDCQNQLKLQRNKLHDDIKLIKDTTIQHSNETRQAITELQNQTTAGVNAALQSFESSMSNRYKPIDSAIDSLKQQLHILHKKYDELYTVTIQQQQLQKQQHRISHINTTTTQHNPKMNNNAPVFVPAASPRHSAQHSHTSSISVNSPQTQSQPLQSSTAAPLSQHNNKPISVPPSTTSTTTSQSSSSIDPWTRQPVNTDEYGLNIGGFGSSTWSNASFNSTLSKYNAADSDDNEASRTLRMLGLDDRDTS